MSADERRNSSITNPMALTKTRSDDVTVNKRSRTWDQGCRVNETSYTIKADIHEEDINQEMDDPVTFDNLHKDNENIIINNTFTGLGVDNEAYESSPIKVNHL